MQVRKDAGKEIKLSCFIFFYFCLRLVFTLLGSLAIVCMYITAPTIPSYLAQVGFEEPKQENT